MAYDKVIDSAELDDNLLELANAIRLASGTSEAITFPDGFVTAIGRIKTQGTSINVVPYTSIDELLESVVADNTIGVIPVTDISSWVFDTVEPEEPVPGMLWFKTGSGSKVPFNATSGNSIIVRPISAKQYVDDAWIGVVARSYIENKWVNWWGGELYIDGDQFEDYTGGWVNKGIFIYKASSGNVYQSSDTEITFDGPMTVTAPSNRVTFATTVNPVDVSDFAELHCTVPTTVGSAGIYVHKITSGTLTTECDAQLSLVKGDNVLSLLGLEGEYYISIGTVNGRTLTVDNIRLV